MCLQWNTHTDSTQPQWRSVTFSKVLAKSRRRGGGIVKILAVEYVHCTSSSVVLSHKLQSDARVQAASVLALEVWLTAWKAARHLHPSSLHYMASVLIAPAQTDGEALSVLAWTSWLTMPVMGLLKLANYGFYVIGSALFQCMEYHLTTKLRLFIFRFSEC
jgi:hypothetical protein